MINEIEIFYDKEFKKKVDGNISFEPIVAGMATEKSLFIKNNIPFLVNLNITFSEDIQIIKNITKLNSNEIGEIIIRLNPKLTTMKPINAKLNIKGEYIVE